ncbi:hypothetical protein LINPERPRIM_LOCUS9742 [Linum perenne]
MGSCFSKKTVSVACPAGEVQQKREEKKEEDEREEKKEVFVIKHRDSHERRSPSPAPSPEVVLESGKVSTTTSMAVRTSSCTKEEEKSLSSMKRETAGGSSVIVGGKSSSNLSTNQSSVIQQKIKLSRDYTFLLNSVHHLKRMFNKRIHLLQDLLISYNIVVDRTNEMKKVLGKSAASVGLPEIFTCYYR